MKTIGLSRASVALTVVVVVVLVGGGVFFLLQHPSTGSSSQASSTTQTSSSNTSSSITPSVPVLDVKQAVQAHLDTIHGRNVLAVVSAYADDALVTWSGVTRGLGGNYSGTTNIKLLFSAALGTAEVMNFSLSNVTPTTSSSGQPAANANFTTTGTSGILGNFSGKIEAQLTYTYSGGQWKISHETWNFHSFNVEYPGGITTFPQWRTVGGPIDETRSPDSFKQFVWDYGGEGATILVFVYMAALAALLAVKRWN